jgi:hypothetical protein
MPVTRKRKPRLADDDLLGAHVSTAGGVASAIDRACAIGCAGMQIFVKNNMQWFAKPLGAAEARGFREHPLRGSLRFVFGHSGYLINLAASDPALHEMSMRSLREELVRTSLLGLPFLVLHPGAHMGRGVEAGLEQVVASLDAIHALIPETRSRIALETTAGQGRRSAEPLRNWPSSCAAAASRSDSAFASIPRTSSPPVTSLAMRRVLFARSLNSKKSSGSTGSPPFT